MPESGGEVSGFLFSFASKSFVSLSCLSSPAPIGLCRIRVEEEARPRLLLPLTLPQVNSISHANVP